MKKKKIQFNIMVLHTLLESVLMTKHLQEYEEMRFRAVLISRNSEKNKEKDVG